MAYATKNKRKSYAIAMLIAYIILTLLVVIPHRFVSRYAHPVSFLSTMAMLVPIFGSFAFFLRQLNRWVNGQKINIARFTIGLLPSSILLAVILDYTVLVVHMGLPLYQALFKILQILFLVGLAQIAMLFLIIVIVKKLPDDEKIERFFIPIHIKVYYASHSIMLTLAYMLVGFNLYQTESTSIETMANEVRLSASSMVSSINDYVSYLTQQTKIDSDFLSLALANNRRLTESTLLSNLTLVDNQAKDYYSEVSIHLNNTSQGDINLKITPTLEGILSIDETDRVPLNLDGYQRILEYNDLYISYETSFKSEVLYSYINIIAIIRQNDLRVGYLKISTSAKHLKNIVSSYIYPLSIYYIYNSNTGDVTLSSDTQYVRHGLQNLRETSNWDEISTQLLNINSENPRLIIDARNIYYHSNRNHESYFIFAEHIGRLDLIFFQIIPAELLFNVDVVNEGFTKVIIVIIIILILMMTSFNLFIKYIMTPLKLSVDYTKKLREEKKYISDTEVNITNDESGLILINTNAFFASLSDVLTNLRSESTSLDGDFHTLSDILNSNIEILKTQITSVNSTVESISNVLTSISKVNDATTQQKYAFSSANVAIDELLKVISTIEENTEIQSSAVEQTSASIEEIISNISSVARNVSTADSYAKKLVEEGKTGGEIVDEVIDAVKEIEDNSDQIKEIITVIQGIAEQTNLLAMNAAIEAAHAGEQGKGFAIVADEIRSLAEHTADNTKSVTSIIREITKRVANTVSLAVGSGNSLDSIINISERTARVISEINIANNEIEIGGREILETVKNLNTITKKIKDGVEDQVQNSKIVESQVSTLNAITENVSSAITESIVGSNHVNDGLSTLTNLAEKSSESNDLLNEAISKLNVSFGQFNTFVDSFNVDIELEEATKVDEESIIENLVKHRKIKRKKERKKLSLRTIIEEIAYMEETDANQFGNSDKEEDEKEYNNAEELSNMGKNIENALVSENKVRNPKDDINDLFKGVGNIEQYDIPDDDEVK